MSATFTTLFEHSRYSSHEPRFSLPPRDGECAGFPRISRLVSPPGKIAGGFGYESNQPIGSRLSVWLYCFGANGRIKPAAQKQIKSALANSGFNKNQIKDDGASIQVFCKAEQSPGDMEWFTKVLTALNN